MKMFVGTLTLEGKPVLSAGDVFEGDTWLDLIRMMIDPPFFTMNTEKDPDRFIDQCLASINKFSGLNLSVSGGTTEERAENFFEALMTNNLACRVN
jgi:hypothetical protein